MVHSNRVSTLSPTGAPQDMDPVGIAKQIKAIVKKRQALLMEEIRLRILWNTTRAIHTLPAEIFAHIFMFCHTPKKDSLWVSKTRWVRLRLVCRYWRDVVDETPAMWSTVDVYNRDDWLELCLSRSSALPLDISFHETRPGNYHSVRLELLLPHANRIRNLICQGRVTDWQGGSWHLSSLFKTGMPILETLCYMRDKHHGRYFEIEISPDRFPRLRTLRLTGAYGPRDPHVYSQLQELELGPCWWNDFTLRAFVEALAGASNLRRLELRNALAGLRRRNYSPYTATLPQVTTLVLDEPLPGSTAAFLQHVTLPSLKDLHVEADLGNVDRDDVSDTLAELFPSNPADHLPILMRLSEVSLTVYSDEYRIYAWDHGCPRLDLSLYSNSSAVDWYGYESLLLGIQDLADIFRGSQLTELSVFGDHGADFTTSWVDVINALPRLQVLNLKGGGWATGFWRALKFSSEALSPSTSDSDQDVGVELGEEAASTDAPQSESESTLGAVPWPNLRKISQEGTFRANEELFDAMIDCLRARAERGARLHKLYMQVYEYDPEDGDYESFKRAYLPSLKELVDKVTYKRYD